MRKIITLSIIMGVMLATTSMGFAQGAKTADELKAERQQLKTELKSKDAQKTAKSLDKVAPVGGTMADVVAVFASGLPAPLQPAVASVKKLVGDKEARIINKPAATGLNSVDGLCDAGTTLLGVVVSTNAILQEYKIAITESKDGEVDISKFKANSDDYMAILPMLVQAGVDAAKAVEKIKDVQADVKGLNPMQAAPTIKAANWAMDAVNVSVAKIGENTKLLQNLINGIKASKNL